jgi:hypothetical protein
MGGRVSPKGRIETTAMIEDAGCESRFATIILIGGPSFRCQSCDSFIKGVVLATNDLWREWFSHKEKESPWIIPNKIGRPAGLVGGNFLRP